jgi:DNA-binding response OmpR family regulator
MPEQTEDRETLLKQILLLVVEDERDTRELLRFLLRQHGAEVMAADNVSMAMAIFDERRPDVVIADIGMPGNDGFALIAHVRSVDATPVVAVTAYSHPGARERGLSAGFNAYLGKPFDPEELVKTVRKLYDERKPAPGA